MGVREGGGGECPGPCVTGDVGLMCGALAKASGNEHGRVLSAKQLTPNALAFRLGAELWLALRQAAIIFVATFKPATR